MGKQIKKYVETYIVYFKWDNQEPIEIWKEAWINLLKNLNDLTFFTFNWEAYNKFEILKVKKRKCDYEVWELLKLLPENVKWNVIKEMKFYKKELTKWVIKNMIQKYEKK